MFTTVQDGAPQIQRIPEQGMSARGCGAVPTTRDGGERIFPIPKAFTGANDKRSVRKQYPGGLVVSFETEPIG
jgi:hypothetical protein